MPCDDCSRAETCPPCVNGEARVGLSNPKREVLDALGDPEQEGWLASYLDLYAHKLAEQQRRYAEDILDSGYASVIEPGQLKTVVVAAVSLVADLIDPKSREELRP